MTNVIITLFLLIFYCIVFFLPAKPTKRPAHPPQRVSIQPKPPPSVPLTQPVAPFLKTRTIVIQPVGLQTVVSVVKAPPPVTVHATAPSTGERMFILL